MDWHPTVNDRMRNESRKHLAKARGSSHLDSKVLRD